MTWGFRFRDGFPGNRGCGSGSPGCVSSVWVSPPVRAQVGGVSDAGVRRGGGCPAQLRSAWTRRISSRFLLLMYLDQADAFRWPGRLRNAAGSCTPLISALAAFRGRALRSLRSTAPIVERFRAPWLMTATSRWERFAFRSTSRRASLLGTEPPVRAVSARRSMSPA